MNNLDLARKLAIQGAAQDGKDEIVYVLTQEEKELLKKFTIEEFKTIPDFGAKKITFEIEE